MLIKLANFFCAVVMFMLGTTVAFAHTSAASTTPKTGSVLDQSPPAIEITFKEAARLTSVVVHQEGKPERKLAFEPKTSGTTFKIANPKLAEGKSEVHWIALSRDGHVVKGVIVLSVKAPAAKTS
jgi:methionine-rich copper-binding protein CopC